LCSQHTTAWTGHTIRWPDPEAAFAELPALFDRIVVSDIAWARLEPWRRALAELWPEIGNIRRLRVRGPRAEARLLAGWLRSRLECPVELEHEPADATDLVEADGSPAIPDRTDPGTPSALLSAQLEIYGRDPVYEDAVRA